MSRHANPFAEDSLKVHFKQIRAPFNGIDERDSGIILKPIAVFTNRPNGDGNPVTIVERDYRDGGFINVTAQYAKDWEKLEDAKYSAFQALYDALIGHGEIVFNRDEVLNSQSTGDIDWIADDWRRNLEAATKGEGFCYDEDGDENHSATVAEVMDAAEICNLDVKFHIVPSVRHPSDTEVGRFSGSLESFKAQVAASPNVFITDSAVVVNFGKEYSTSLDRTIRDELLKWARDFITR